MKVNYTEIFKDILIKRNESVDLILNFENDFEKIIELNYKIFKEETKKNKKENSRLKSYSIDDIIKILKISKQENLTNKQICNRFSISINSLYRWKRTLDIN